MDGLTLAVGNGGGPRFQFIAFTGKIGDGETGTFNYLPASNDDEGEFTVVSPGGFVSTLRWPSMMTFNNYTMTINGPSSVVLTLTGTPQGSTLFGGPAPTKFTMLLRTTPSGFLEVVPNALILDDPQATVFFNGTLTVTSGGPVPNGYRSERQDQDPEDRDSKIAPGGIDGDVYILDLPDATSIYLNHGSTTLTAPTPAGATEIGNALFTRTAGVPPLPTAEEVSYSYLQLAGSDSSRVTLTPTGVNRVMLPAPMTISLDYLSSRHGTFILSGGGLTYDGMVGTFVNFDKP